MANIKRTFLVVKAGRFTDETGKVVALQPGAKIVLTEDVAATHGDLLQTLPPDGPKKPYVVKRGEFTQQDAAGNTHVFHEGDTIQLTIDEAASYEPDRLEPAVTKPAPAVPVSGADGRLVAAPVPGTSKIEP